MASNPLDHVVQHPLKEVPLDAGALTPNGVITVLSDHIAMTILSGLLLCLFLPWAMRRRRQEGIEGLVATGFANFIEVVCEFLRKQVAEPALEHHTDRFIKYIWSVFFFVLTMNLLGLVPLGVITPLAVGYHIGGTATANIWVTGTLALMTLVMMVVNGIRLGGMDYLMHFMPGPLLLKPLMLVVEIMGMLAKIFALAIRLFANMLAGHLILVVLLGLVLGAGSSSAALGYSVAVPVVLGSVALSMLEIFVAFLQAFIFALLTTLFIGMSVVFHHDEHEEAAAH